MGFIEECHDLNAPESYYKYPDGNFNLFYDEKRDFALMHVDLERLN